MSITCCFVEALNRRPPQVEKVICYDVFQSPLRGIQRMGRTGRHEAGKVVHILSEGQEEDKFHNNAEVLLPGFLPMSVKLVSICHAFCHSGVLENQSRHVG